MSTDPFAQFKAAQREGWGLFAPVEALTTPAAAQLVNFADVRSEQHVLDAGCGTGVVAVTAARRSAPVKGLDLSPKLLERARWNAATAEVEVEFTEGDVEALPYGDAEFDVVLSQFGHMFAPRPAVATAEMLRVLKPGGTIAFATWPPEQFTGRVFALTARHVPPPEGVAPPGLWGDPSVIRERLGDAVTDLRFERDTLRPAALSPQHMRSFLESTVAPLAKVVQTHADDPTKLADFRKELDALIAEYFQDNTVRQHYALTRARKV
jgi:SAM-dependent methyltransferase